MDGQTSKNLSPNELRLEGQIASVLKDHVKPTPLEITLVDVSVSLRSSAFQAWFEAFCFHVENLDRCGNFLNSWSRERFAKYLNTVLASRCAYVRGERFVLRYNECYVPAFFAVAVAKIGKTFDRVQGIQLLPVYDGPDDLMTREEALSFALVLELLERHGFVMSDCVAKATQGDYTTMAFFVTETHVLSHEARLPEANSVIAAFLNLSGIETVVAPRICYAQVDFISAAIRQFANPDRSVL